MAFLLCHDCFSWVEPADGRCPECHQAVDPSVSDPPLAALQAVIGELVQPLGAVRVPRRTLPEYGTLYVTTNGLCFVPHQAVYPLQDVEVPGTPSLFWTLAAVLWSPLMFITPLVRTRQIRKRRIQVLQPRRFEAGESDGLSWLLMQDPGTFFIPRRLIRRIRQRRRRWTIERLQGTPVRIEAQTDRREFRARMTELLTSSSWQGLA